MITTRELENLGLDGETANRWRQVLNEHATGSTDETWDSFVRSCHAPGLPFAAFQAVYRALQPSDRPLPAWQPDEDAKQNSNLARAMRELGHDDVQEFHRWSVTEKSAFWQFVVERLGIAFDKPATEALRDSEFFPGAELNIVESCFLADSEAIAIRYRGGADGQTVPCVVPFGYSQDGTWTYGELEAATKQVADSLIRLGLKPGDRVAIDMPMTPESVAIYLGIIYSGMAVVSIADSFAAEEIRARLRIAETKLIFTQDVIPRGGKILPLYEKVKQASPVRAVVLSAGGDLQVSLQDSDLTWDTFLYSGDSNTSPHPASPNTETNILFSSGTTGDPKAIPWTHLTPVKAAMDGHFHQDIRPGDVVAWPTNLGWMMGPWLIYAALINRATIALYGGSPIERGFGEFVADAGVTMLGLVPSVVKSWRAAGTMEGLNWSSIRVFSSTGECSTADDYLYLMWLAGFRPVIEYCGGTEIGGGYITGTILQPAAPATFSTAALGLDFHIFGDDGKPAQTGEVFIDPVSIGLSRSLLNRDHDEVYFADCPRDESGQTLRRHGDEIQVAGDFYRALGRADDTMNLGGIKVSSAEIEQVVSQAEGVVESAAVARTPEGGGPSELVIFVVVSGTAKGLGEMRADMQQRIRDRLNPLFKITALQSIDSLPRTASNKVMRRML